MKKFSGCQRTVLFALGLLLSPVTLQAAEGAGVANNPQASQQAPQAAAKTTADVQSAINVNKASAEELTGLDGVGPAKAKAIVAYREANGPFRDKAQLLNVKGIGEAILKKNEARIAF